MKLSSIVPWGRGFAEYRDMFALSDADMSGRVLGCGDGPASFNAEATALGARVVSIDPVYAFAGEEIEARVRETFPTLIGQARDHAERFVWTRFADADALGAAVLLVRRQPVDDEIDALRIHDRIEGSDTKPRASGNGGDPEGRVAVRNGTLQDHSGRGIELPELLCQLLGEVDLPVAAEDDRRRRAVRGGNLPLRDDARRRDCRVRTPGLGGRDGRACRHADPGANARRHDLADRVAVAGAEPDAVRTTRGQDQRLT